MKRLIVDASIPIAKFRGEEPAFQQSQTDRFFELVGIHPLKIEIIKKVLDEVSSKYDYLMPSVDEFFNKLRSDGKFELIENSVFEKDIGKIAELRANAKSNDFDLSFRDALQIFYAMTTKYPLISWDGAIVDYCEEQGIAAFRPSRFCDYYEQKYC